MDNENAITKKLCVDGIDPDLYLKFKMILLQRNIGIRKVIIHYLEAFVEAGEGELRRGSGVAL
ncbi:hypothetical protein ES703_59926 [subsurface metagenome]